MQAAALVAKAALKLESDPLTIVDPLARMVAVIAQWEVDEVTDTDDAVDRATGLVERLLEAGVQLPVGKPDLVLARRIVNLLNEATKLDPTAMHQLVESRACCNDQLAKHPTIQVAWMPQLDVNGVGILGILNGLCGMYPDGWYKGCGPITALFDTVEGLPKLTGFGIFHECVKKAVKRGKKKK